MLGDWMSFAPGIVLCKDKDDDFRQRIGYHNTQFDRYFGKSSRRAVRHSGQDSTKGTRSMGLQVHSQATFAGRSI